MTGDPGYRLHPGAAQDIVEVWDFMARENPLVAGRFREGILDAVRELVLFPRQGHLRTDLTSRLLRFVSRHDYLIAYAPDEKPLVVIAILHGRRNPDVLSSILRGRR